MLSQSISIILCYSRYRKRTFFFYRYWILKPLMQNAEYTNVLIRIKGLVQGIGFRPHVYRTALARNISGTVGNTVDGVEIHARGSAENIESFIDDLQHHRVPPAAIIQDISVREEEKILYSDFKIVKSPSQGDSITRISPDLAVCQDCLGPEHGGTTPLSTAQTVDRDFQLSEIFPMTGIKQPCRILRCAVPVTRNSQT